MAKKIKFHRKAFEELRNEPQFQDLVNELAYEVGEEAAKVGGWDDLPVFEVTDPPSKGRSGYQVTELTLENPRNAASVMAVGKAHHHNRQRSSLLRGLSAVARKHRD